MKPNKKSTKKEFSDFVWAVVKSKPSNELKGKDYNPTKKKLEQKFIYVRHKK